MTDAHRAVLEALNSIHDDYDGGGYAHFSYVIERTGFPRPIVRRICRYLARRGLAEYSRGLWSEDGEPAGAGYGITKAGIAALAEGGRTVKIVARSIGGGRFSAELEDGRLLVRSSRAPLLAAARVLLAEGVNPATAIALVRPGSETESLRSTVGTAARFVVSEEGGRPRFVPFREYPREPLRARTGSPPGGSDGEG
jgi:hypothetical protein